MEDEESDDSSHDTSHKRIIGVNTERLIELVKKRPGLWDKGCREYRFSKQNRHKQWQVICEEMYPDFKNLTKTKQFDMVRKVQKKWYNTRDSYRKSQKRVGKPYLFAEQMSFLGPPDVCGKHLDNEEDPSNFLCGDKSDDEDYVQEVYLDTEDNEIIEKKHSKVKRQGLYLEADDLDVSPAKVFRNNLSNQDVSWVSERQSTSHDSLLPVLTSIMKREDDEDRGFFNSLLPAVKKLSSEDKMEFKIRVLTVLKALSVKKEKDPIENEEF